MNIREQVLAVIKKFAETHSAELLSLEKFSPNPEDPSAFDYLPDWNESRTLPAEKNPENFVFVKEISEIVFDMIFGSNLKEIKFDLMNHIPYAHGKSWTKVASYEKENFFWDKLSPDALKSKLTTNVFLALVHFTFFKDEDESFVLQDLKAKRYKYAFSDIICNHCDKTLYVDYNVETKTFESHVVSGSCQINN